MKITKLVSSFGRLLFVFACSFMLLAVTSCDKEEETMNTYNMGFTQYSSSDMDAIVDMAKIEKVFKEKLGVTENTFFLSGNTEECDRDVIYDCQQAEEALKGNQWNSSFTFEVQNVTTETVIYTYKN